MTLNEYQDQAVATAVYGAGHKISYPILGLNGEAGEVANTYKKILRNHDGYISFPMRQKLIDELGDVLWYLAATARDLDCPLEYLAERNLVKLAERQRLNQLKEHPDDNF